MAGLRVAQAYGRERAQRRRVRRPQRRLPALPAAGPALHRHLLPVRRAAVRPRGGRGARRRARPGWPRATLTAGALIAFLLYLDMFFAPVQQLSQVFDGYQQAAVGLRRIGELLRTPTACRRQPTATPVPVPARLRGEVELARRRASRYAGAAEPALDRRRPAHRAGRDGGAGRRDRRGQVHAGQAARPVLRRRRRARCSSTASTCARYRPGRLPAPARRGAAGAAPVHRRRPRQHRLRRGRTRSDAEVEAAARAVGRARR